MILVALTIISLINLGLNVFIFKFIKSLSLTVEESPAEFTAQNDHDIHNILNNRLLDLQNRRYSVPQRRNKYE